MISLFNPTHYSFNPHSIPYFCAGILALLEGLFIFLQNKKSILNIAFSLVGFFCFIWLTGVGIFYNAVHEEIALVWIRYYTFFGVLFIAPAVHLFSAAWRQTFERQKGLIIFNFATGLLLYFFCISSPLFIQGVWKYPWGFYTKAAVGNSVAQAVFLVVMTLSLYNFIKAFQEAGSMLTRRQTKIMLAAFSVAFLGVIDFLPNHGIAIYPLGYIPLMIFLTMIGYAIAQYKVLDIETVLHKTVMWFLTTVISIAPFAFLIYKTLGWVLRLPPWAATLYFLTVLLIFSIYFRKVQPILDHLFRRQRAGFERILEIFSKELVHLKNLRDLLQKSARTFRRSLYVKKISIYLQDSAKQQWVPVLAKAVRGLQPIPYDHPFAQWLEAQDRVVVGALMEDDPSIAPFKKEVAQYFQEKEAEVAVPLTLQGKLIGIIHLGRKENLRRYYAADVHFLTLAKFPLTIALSNSMQFENISRLYNQVQAQNERLKELDRLKSEFLANTSHELRTPLNGILGLVEAILDGADGELNDPQRRHLAMIIESGANLKELINNLLELSRMESGQMKLKVKSFNVLNVIDAVLTLLEGVAKKKGIKLQRTGGSRLSDIYGDPEKIQRVVMNLVGNAVKFTHEGSVTVNVEEDLEALKISVIDTGIGISVEDQKVIFDRFRQADGSATREYEGTGLGLSIAREIVRLHSSDIHLESEKGKGSRFSFYLPKSEQALGTGPRVEGYLSETGLQYKGDLSLEQYGKDDTYSFSTDREYQEAVRGSGEKILIIDDNPVNREVVKTRLEIHGYQVIEAKDGIEGMEKTKESHPDLIILDLMMPRMSGYEFCKKIRETDSADQLPIIMLTAKTDMGDKVYGLNLGANDYIAKPFNKDELIARVGILIKIRKMTQELKRWNAELEQRVDQRTKELAKTQEQLVQAEKLATIGTLAGGVAHEINNPLTAVLTNAQILKMTATGDDDLETLSLIEEGAKRCQTIVQKLLKYARQPEQDHSKNRVHLTQVIQNAVSMLQYQINQDNIEIEIQGSPQDEIAGISNEMEQVFTNLILNARDAIRSAKRAKGRIRIVLEAMKEGVQVKVFDNGTGIKKEHINRIFDPFFTTKDVGEGTGLGLAVTQSILQKHKCQVRVESEAGSETVFTLLFPKFQGQGAQKIGTQ